MEQCTTSAGSATPLTETEDTPFFLARPADTPVEIKTGTLVDLCRQLIEQTKSQAARIDQLTDTLRRLDHKCIQLEATARNLTAQLDAIRRMAPNAPSIPPWASPDESARQWWEEFHKANPGLGVNPPIRPYDVTSGQINITQTDGTTTSGNLPITITTTTGATSNTTTTIVPRASMPVVDNVFAHQRDNVAIPDIMNQNVARTAEGTRMLAHMAGLRAGGRAETFRTAMQSAIRHGVDVDINEDTGEVTMAERSYPDVPF